MAACEDFSKAHPPQPAPLSSVLVASPRGSHPHPPPAKHLSCRGPPRLRVLPSPCLTPPSPPYDRICRPRKTRALSPLAMGATATPWPPTPSLFSDASLQRHPPRPPCGYPPLSPLFFSPLISLLPDCPLPPHLRPPPFVDGVTSGSPFPPPVGSPRALARRTCVFKPNPPCAFFL